MGCKMTLGTFCTPEGLRTHQEFDSLQKLINKLKCETAKHITENKLLSQS